MRLVLSLGLNAKISLLRASRVKVNQRTVALATLQPPRPPVGRTRPVASLPLQKPSRNNGGGLERRSRSCRLLRGKKLRLADELHQTCVCFLQFRIRNNEISR